MATALNENPENSSARGDAAVEQNHEIPDSEMPNHGGLAPEPSFSEEEVRGALEISASTGKFWLDWEKLRSILSFHLKQVLSEYPESNMTVEQQTSALGETFQELVKRLDDALHSFDEGPPFTLQRLCEILLSARSIYPKLLKLSLALDKTVHFNFMYDHYGLGRSCFMYDHYGLVKNILVTSTLKICTDPYPPTTEQNSNGAHEGNGNALPQNNAVENGGLEPPVEDRDEVMTDAQEAEVVIGDAQEAEVVIGDAQEAEVVINDNTMMDMETAEDVAKSPEANPAPKVDS